MHKSVSIVIPAKNEAASLERLMPDLQRVLPDAEIIVVDDGSSDKSSQVCEARNVNVLRHPYSMGNGAAVKTGARAATGEYLVLMDADGQHSPESIRLLLNKIDEGFDLVIGARDRTSQSSKLRWIANSVYNLLASWMVGQKVSDLTSGFRVVRAALFREIIYMLPNGFSYPTTSTMAFFRAGHPVGFVPIQVSARGNNSASHIRLLRDGARFLLIIFRVGTLYSPLKMFLPVSLLFFALGTGYIAYTLGTFGRFTNFGGLLLVTSVVIFLIGLVSEQITSLLYLHSSQAAKSDNDD